MTEFSTEEVIRQSLRSLVHELAMGLLASKDKNGKKQLVQTKTKNYIRSVEFLRKLYDNPARHLSKVLSDAAVAGQAPAVSPKEQRGIIVSYLHEVGKMKPPAVRDWELLRHYLFFFYRQFTSPDPNDDDNPSPPVFFMREIRDVVERLMVEDATQLFLRLFALIREFIQTAQQFFQIDVESEDNLDEEYYFSNMLKYYAVLSKAAEGFAPILPELENLLMRKYKINWVMFNKSLFYHYFYKKSDVKERMKKVRKEMDHPPEPDSPENRVRREVQCIEDSWYMCVLKITSDRESMAMKDPEIVDRSLKMMAEHKKILKTNFWIIRSLEQKLIQDMTLLDSQLVLWVGDTEHSSEKLMNWKGQCICEDCMLVEYETGKHLPPFIRLIGCKICYSGVPIGDYISHMIIKHLPAEKKTDFVRKDTSSKKKLPNKKLTTKFCKLLAEAAEAVQAEEQPPQFKMPPEKRLLENGKTKYEPNFAAHFNVSDGTDTVLQNTPEENREAIGGGGGGGLKLGAEAEDVINSMPEADTFRMMAATLQNMVISKAEQEKAKKSKKIHNGFDEKCCEHVDEAASVVSSSSSSSKPLSRSHASCSHSSCKHLDDNQFEDNKKSCPYGCDHHKELKKCDCTYCEVFGTSVAMHAHKISETRDRLRSRLNQRKEKFNGASTSSPYPNASVKIPPKPLATMSKVVVNSSKKLEKTLCPVLTPPRHNSVPRTISEPNMGEESRGQASLPRTLAASKFDSDGLHQSVFSISTCSINSLMKDDAILGDNTDSRDIDDLLNYILGNKNVDKVALAQKKAAKKARQRQKREEERLRLEAEEKRKAAEKAREEKRREDERLKAEALAKELAERAARKNKKAQNEAKKQQKEDKKSNKKNKKQKAKPEEREVLMEETIPAMVTIKRVIENDHSPPTVTITLKGSTPDQDKLLYTLVNGYNNNNKEQTTVKHDSAQESNKNKKKNKTPPQQPAAIKITEPVLNVATKKKKNKNGVRIEETTKEVKVTLAVDKSIAKQTKTVENNKKNKTEEKKKQPPAVVTVANNKQKQKPEKSKPVDNKREERDVAFNIPMLRLPPGITITKVDGPVNNRNNKAAPAPPHQPLNNSHNNSTHTAPAHHHQHQNSRMPMSKSGVIVVDTEKLIQQSASIISNKKRKKKNKKENAAQAQEQKNGCNGTDKASPSMITLKNPIFHTLQTTLANKVTEKLAPEGPVMSCNQQASIIKNDNGMVTIRSPRLQQSLNNGTPIPNLLTDLKPVIGPEVTTCHTSFSDNSSRISTLNAQEILSGLPGIEITKVDKKNPKQENDVKKSCQAADVSIIPTTNGNFNNDKFSFDRDDWHYESVFTPKDILEDDLDAEERELEAFKRFCQQSVPPKRKEKVAHLNVKDIVLIKKNDVTYI